MRKLLMGCGALSLGGLAIIIIAAILAGIGSSSSPTGGGANGSSSEATNAPVQEEPKYAVRVSGNQGVKYSCEIGNLNTSRTVDAVLDATPDVYKLNADPSWDTVSAWCTHESGGGLLKVEILENGKPVKQASTSAQYGNASVDYNIGF